MNCVHAALSWTAELLGLNSDQLAEVLTHRSMILRGEEISTPLTVEQVCLKDFGKILFFFFFFIWKTQISKTLICRAGRRWTPETPWQWHFILSVSTGSSTSSTTASGAKKTSNPSASWTFLGLRTLRFVPTEENYLIYSKKSHFVLNILLGVKISQIFDSGGHVFLPTGQPL